jgi:hypothetical protein
MATWKIESLVVKPLDGTLVDVVVTATWRCTDTSGAFTASSYGSIGLAAPGETFVAYPDLTEATVLGWIWSQGVDKDEVEAKVALELSALVTPPTISKPLPWEGA